MSALFLYMISHDVTLALITHKGKIKGRKKLIRRINISVAIGRTVMYVRIYYTGGFQNGQVHLR